MLQIAMQVEGPQSTAAKALQNASSFWIKRALRKETAHLHLILSRELSNNCAAVRQTIHEIGSNPDRRQENLDNLMNHAPNIQGLNWLIIGETIPWLQSPDSDWAHKILIRFAFRDLSLIEATVAAFFMSALKVNDTAFMERVASAYWESYQSDPPDPAMHADDRRLVLRDGLSYFLGERYRKLRGHGSRGALFNSRSPRILPSPELVLMRPTLLPRIATSAPTSVNQTEASSCPSATQIVSLMNEETSGAEPIRPGTTYAVIGSTRNYIPLPQENSGKILFVLDPSNPESQQVLIECRDGFYFVADVKGPFMVKRPGSSERLLYPRARETIDAGDELSIFSHTIRIIRIDRPIELD
jgi:hypothetical protein